MLFFNFICLFYLMVLVSSHTISKSIAKDEKIDEIIDSVNSLESTTEYNIRHDRFHHKFRREDAKHKAKTSKSKTPQPKQKAHIESSKGTSKYTELFKSKTSATVANITQELVKTTGSPTSTTVEYLWRRLQKKLRKKDKTTTKVRRAVKKRKSHFNHRNRNEDQQKFDSDIYTHFNDYSSAFKTKYDNSRRLGLEKREAQQNVTSGHLNIVKRDGTVTTLKTHNFKLPYKTYEPLFENNNVTATTEKLTTHVNESPKVYTWSDDNVKPYVYNFTPYTTESNNKHVQPTTDLTLDRPQTEFPGTAALEALLNEIKVNAIKMIAEQNPGVSDVITNSVTETTFEADPLLKNGEIRAIVNFNSDGNEEETRDQPVIPKLSTVINMLMDEKYPVTISGVEHKMDARSVKEVKQKVVTMACDFENKLEKELKCAYKKAKHKLYQQICRELGEARHATKKIVDTAANELKDIANRIEPSKPCKPCKTTKCKSTPKKICGCAVKTLTTTPISRNHRATITARLEKKLHKQPKITAATENTLPSLEDDYAMLKLFEQVLAKTHEDNVMKMLTTQNAVSKRRSLKEKLKISKRNLETIENMSLKENIRKMNDGEGMPDSEDPLYNNDDFENNSNNTANRHPDEGNEYYDSPMNTVTETMRKLATEDTSYEGLTNKISFNEYVNGYKHYLNFTKELNDQNFSDRIRYQAHRHHNVDDIGKYILNKLPTLPKYDFTKRGKRYFFDDSDGEEQDISTKSDDSWFKKHFYLFLDSAPQKKFHTSQTVTLKYPVEEHTFPEMEMKIEKRKDVTGMDYDSSYSSDTPETTKYKITGNEIVDNVNEIDDMMKTLDNSNTPTTIFGNDSMAGTYNDYSEAHTTKSSGNYSNMLILKSPQYLLDKLLGRSGRKSQQNNSYSETQIETPEDVSYRFKRHNKKANPHSASYVQKDDFEHRKSSPSPNLFENKNFGYVDMNLVAKPTTNVRPKSKKGKIGRFFDKLKFTKKKEKKKGKRNIRMERYNPFKKLKEIFQKKESLTPLYDLDYNMITTDMNSFKIVKYNKAPSMSEIFRQVPNITMDEPNDDNNFDNMLTYSKMASGIWAVTESPPKAIEAGLIKSFTVLPDAYDMKEKEKYLDSIKPFNIKVTSDSLQNLMSVTTPINIRETVSITPHAVPHITVDEIMNAVNKVQSHVNFKETAPHKMSVKPTERYKAATRMRNYKASFPKANYAKIRFNTNFDDVRIRPITRFTVAPYRTRIFAYTRSAMRQNRKSVFPKKITRSTTETTKETPLFKTETPHIVTKYAQLPDYFNDLINWHKDILGMDKVVSNPHYELAMKTINEEITTPNLKDIQSEIVKMKEFLNSFEAMKSTKMMKPGPEPPKKINIKFIDRRHKTNEVVNGLDKVYLKSFRSFQSEMEKALGNDTSSTLLASTEETTPLAYYDDTLNILSDDMRAKNDVATRTKMKGTSPKAKVSTPPEQYFTTPVPMQATDFDKFLKENHMDVQSVTSPFTEISKFEENWSKRSHIKSKLMSGLEPYPKSHRSFQLYESTIPPMPLRSHYPYANNFNTYTDFPSKEREVIDEIDYLNQLESSLIEEVDKEQSRLKRQDSEEEIAEYDPLKEKRKISFFNKRHGHKNGANKLPSAELNSGLDITIIDFDDKQNIYNSLLETTDFVQVTTPTPKLGSQPLDDLEEMVKEKKILKEMKGLRPAPKMHNKLLYKERVSQPKTQDIKIQMVNKAPLPNLKSFKSHMHHFPTELMKALPKLRPESLPKRLHISSHSYKYDVIYDEHHNTKGYKNHLTTSNHKAPFHFLADDHQSDIYSDASASAAELRSDSRFARKAMWHKWKTTSSNSSASSITNLKVESTTRKRFKFIPIMKKLTQIGNKEVTKTKTVLSSETTPKTTAVSSTTTVVSLTSSTANITTKTTATTIKPTTKKTQLMKRKQRNDKSHNSVDFNFDEFEKLMRMPFPVHKQKLPDDISLIIPAHLEDRDGKKVLTTSDDDVYIERTSADNDKKQNMQSTDQLPDEQLGLQKTTDFDAFKDIDFGKDDKFDTTTKKQTLSKSDKDSLLDYSREKPTKHPVSDKKNELSRNLDKNKHFAADSSNIDADLSKEESSPSVLQDVADKIDKYKEIDNIQHESSETTSNDVFEDELGTYTDDLTLADKTTSNDSNAGDDQNEVIETDNLPEVKDGIDAVPQKKGSDFLPEKIKGDKWNENSSDAVAETETSSTEGTREATTTRKTTSEATTTKTTTESTTPTDKKTTTNRHTTKKNNMENEGASFKKHSSLKTTLIPKELYKRDLTTVPVFTAKDVAALEIVVDLMKDNADEAVTSNVRLRSSARPDLKGTSNTIQVHIAIPFSGDEKKRSIEPAKVRKVFSAKMSAPVDLEYQVKSYEVNGNVNIVTTPEETFISPGMYLLVANNIPYSHSGFALKPVKGDRVRHIYENENITLSSIKSTSPKNLPRVTLTKEFIQSINEGLLKLYQNLSAVNDSGHKISKRNYASNCNKHKGKHGIVWEKVKKFFGHDRVCTCKCKVNETMCRACAASDAVMSELLFEFDNLAKYMNDHCTEVQTYFWMNPTGGRKLRDLVRNIDKNLNDYYKRVKGKCQGRTCKTFQTYIDKRQFTEPLNIDKKYLGDPLLKDLERLYNDIKEVNHLKLRYDDAFKSKAEKFMHAAQLCLTNKSKRSMTDNYKKEKTIYSLDNINVNIICNQGKSTEVYSMPNFEPDLTLVTEPNLISKLYHYDDDEVFPQRKAGLKKLFSKKKKMRLQKNHKRDIVGQIESPLIADAGGSFWSDYLKSEKINGIENNSDNSKPTHNQMDRLYNELAKEDPNIKATLVKVTSAKELLPDNMMILQVTKPIKRIQARSDDSTTITIDTADTESLSRSMNELIKLFESLPDVQEVKNLTVTTKLATTTKKKEEKDKKTTTRTTTKTSTTKFLKPQHTTKILKADKKKNKHPTAKTTDRSTTLASKAKTVSQMTNDIETSNNEKKELESKQKSTSDLTTTEVVANVDSDLMDISSMETKLAEKTSPAITVTSKKVTSWLGKIKSIITGDQSNLVNTLPYREEVRETRSPALDAGVNIDVNSEATTVTYPTIFIIEELVGSKELSADDRENLLSSILNFEKRKIDDEIRKFVKKSIENETNMEDDMNDIYMVETNKFLLTTSVPKKVVTEHADGDYPSIFSKITKNTLTTKKPKKTLLQLLEVWKTKQNTVEKKAGTRTSKEARQQQRAVNNKWILGESVSTLLAQELPSTRATFKMMTVPLITDYSDDKTTTSLDTITTTSSTSTGTFTTTSKADTTTPTSKITTTAMTTTPTTTFAPTTTAAKTSTSKKAPPPASKSSVLTTTTTAKSTTTSKNTLAPSKKTVATKTSSKTREDRTEACDPESRLCDLRATLAHVADVRRTMPRRDFERYVRNVSCYRYKKAPKYFIIEPRKRKALRSDFVKSKESDSNTAMKKLRWDWIRNKRSLLSIDDGDSDEETVDDFDEDIDETEDTFQKDEIEIKDGYSVLDDDNVDMDSGYFERLFKGEDGVYRKKMRRRKRTVKDMNELSVGLKYLPPLKPAKHEIFVMLGDTATIRCSPHNAKTNWIGEFIWETDRTSMLTYDNVVMQGDTIVLKNVQARNVGNYSCTKNNRVHRVVKLSVLTLPEFNVVFIPMYDSKDGCTYDDLRALQRLGRAMSDHSCNGGRDSIRIDEPICLEDKDDSSILLRAVAIMTACPHPKVRCSAECLRDLQCSLALMCASNVPALSGVKVLIARAEANKSLTPSFKANRKLIVTHTLRKKDLHGISEYHQLAASMYPGNLDIVVSCPAGYYLLPRLKICVACPADTFSPAGDNACYSCGAGAGAEPGAQRCKLSLRRLRRYDWWWYPPCGYIMAGGGVLLACVACAACGLFAHVTARSTSRAHAEAVSVARMESRWRLGRKGAAKKCSSTSAAGRRGPISPSAVILARFFRVSQSSSRATDSQETKFEQWKERNKPPPLPPIDFDLS